MKSTFMSCLGPILIRRAGLDELCHGGTPIAILPIFYLLYKMLANTLPDLSNFVLL